MPIYKAPIRDFQFVLHEFINLQKYNNLAGFEDASPDVVDAILEEGAKLAEHVLQPINLPGDEEGCHWKDGVVTTPKGFKAAYDTYVEGGWQGLTANPEFGGQGLPQSLGLAISEMMVAANWGFAMYPGLTKGATEAIETHGTDEQKQIFLPPMISGKWSGTMNLTEPHCGTDLGLMRTKAEQQADGTYRISGTKIFISAGEHDLSENIIHLVLAKIPGGPAGIKGVSLFIVPKFLVDKDGKPGARNKLGCGSIEEKMGIHSNATCVMNYDGAVGYLIGEAHKGMRAMFTMMNEARLGVGLQGLAISDVAYQNAATYARERLQGRALTGPVNKDAAADPIIVHPDVRRMLMTARAFNEGARALVLWTGVQIDQYHKHDDEKVRERAEDLVALLTPVIKSYMTDKGLECTILAQQCWGGHGYIRENGVEQFVRDARIAPIYEGANGVQAMDLVGRKLGANGGRAIRAYFEEVQKFIDDNKADEKMTPFTKPLAKALEQLQQATMWLMQNAMTAPDNAGAAAHQYLTLMALVTFGWFWGGMAKVAQDQLDAGASDAEFYQNKLTTGRFFMSHMMPDATAALAKIEAGAENMMALDASAF
jgi:acyl-CoA dehydrogenase